MKSFHHHNVAFYPEYKDLTTEEINGGRYYTTPLGVKYPSITTVLSVLGKEGLNNWKERVGEEEAKRVSHHAATRGTALHAVVERYISNEVDYLSSANPIVRANFASIKPVLDSKIGNIYGLEVPMYSDHLNVAGRCDCIADFGGILSIIDYKTSAKPKKKEYIEAYFLQEAAYAIMFEERTGIPVSRLITIIAVDYSAPQIFIESRDAWTDKLLDTIKSYNNQQLTGI